MIEISYRAWVRQNDKVFITEIQFNNKIKKKSKMNNFVTLNANELNKVNGGVIRFPISLPTVPVSLPILWVAL